MSSRLMMSGSTAILDRVVRGSVEETLNALLDAEADRLCNAQRYERSAARRDTRAGHYERKLQTKAGEVKLRIPKLRTQTFETAIIERYRRRESSVEEALIEMYLAGSRCGGLRTSPRRCGARAYRRRRYRT
jgi:transposase-like protein